MTQLLDGTVVDESITAANYTPAEKVPLAFGGLERNIESITIHHWGNLGQRFDDVVAYLASANARQSSAHAIIASSRATSIVSPDDAAWHAGNARGSATSIGLELRPEATDGDYRTASAYIYMLRGIYGDLPLIPHNHWTSTACPGKWDLGRLDDEARSWAEQEEIMALSDDDVKRIAKATAHEFLNKPAFDATKEFPKPPTVSEFYREHHRLMFNPLNTNESIPGKVTLPRLVNEVGLNIIKEINK